MLIFNDQFDLFPKIFDLDRVDSLLTLWIIILIIYIHIFTIIEITFWLTQCFWASSRNIEEP